jgi:N-acetylglucosaminyldiphosphoundecaprenol N-acetyl-beta-D-mannosaminyltransferase
VYFLGGKPSIAEKAAEKMKEKYPALIVSGCHDGYFSKVDTLQKAQMHKNGEIIEEDAAVIKEINDSGAKILLCCLGVPKQEIWMNAHRDELNVDIVGGFGGSFDVFAGAVKRAPKIFIKLGLEWFYRLIKEPSRIGRMMSLPRFVFGTLFSKDK